ncbi:zinc finger protein 888-like [Chironomus tepperi]|uniref:zinc finger protein 888-like n=1 Tax=Chironomus tepperi TaxID=113505 RepID=UPI00391FAE22
MEIYDASEILKLEASKHKTVIHIENPDKCRLCLKAIKNRIIITNAIRRNFLDVTQTELLTSDKLSKFICSKCDKDLKDAHLYREKLIETQRKLCEEVGETPMFFMPEVVHLKQEKVDILNEEDYDNDDFGGGDDYSDCGDSFEAQSYNFNDVTDDKSENEKEVKELKDNKKENNKKIQHKPRTRSKKSEEDIKQESDEEFKPDSGDKRKSKKGNGRRKRLYDYYDPELDKEVQERKVTEENGRTYYLCSYCGKNMKSAFSLKEHILTQHRDLEKKFHCNYEGCGRSYVTENRLMIHKQFHKYTKQVICPTCGKVQSSKNRLREHIQSVHEKVQKYFCDMCSFSGLLKSRLRAHVRTHIQKENRRNHPCHICDFVSVCPKYLKRHILDHELAEQGIKKESHIKLEPFICHCGKVFSYKAALQMHVRCVHDKVKKNICSICNHAFFHKVDLQNHILVKHNREKLVKNMPCDICGKLFGIEKQLARHRLYHFIRHECKVPGCDEYFNTAKRLERHIKKVH